MNSTEMTALVRRDLHDEDETAYRWTDEELERHISRAVREFSAALPREMDEAIATISGLREIDISGITNRILVEAVEYPTDRFPRCLCRFGLRGDTITLLEPELPDGSNARIYYGALHTLDESSSTIPVRHENIIATGAEGYAALERALFSINRVNTGGPSTSADLLTWGTGRIDRFRSELLRFGKKNRIRPSTLYRPYSPPVSRSADFGP